MRCQLTNPTLNSSNKTLISGGGGVMEGVLRTGGGMVSVGKKGS